MRLLIIILFFVTSCRSDNEMRGPCVQIYSHLVKTLGFQIKEKKFYKLFLPYDQTDRYIFETRNKFNVEKASLAMACTGFSVSIEGEFYFGREIAFDFISGIETIFFSRRISDSNVEALFKHYKKERIKILDFFDDSKATYLDIGTKSGKSELIFHLNQDSPNNYSLGIVVKSDD